MEATQKRTKGKFHVTSNLKALVQEAKDSFQALEKAEGTFEPGLRFGQAMLDLHHSLEHGDWMPTLKRLEITYRKAQYWMDMVRWQNGERPTSPKKKPNKVALSWDAASRWLDGLRHKVAIARLKKNDPKGAMAFAQELDKLAAELRAGDHDKKRRNHALVLQRKQPRSGSVAAGTHKGAAHTGGGRR